MKDHTDPAYIGPGAWTLLEAEALEARTYQQQVEYAKYVRRTQKNFPCTHCKKHFADYLVYDPPEKSIDPNDRYAMARWIWKFHNAVNKRLGKPFYDWNTFIGKHEPDVGVCSAGCESAGGPFTRIHDSSLISKNPLLSVRAK